MNATEIIKIGKELYEFKRQRELAVSEGERLLFAACSAMQHLQADIDGFWEHLYNAYNIESREELEKEAEKSWYPPNPLVVALHHVWKREPKVKQLQATIAELGKENGRLRNPCNVVRMEVREYEQLQTKLVELKEQLDWLGIQIILLMPDKEPRKILLDMIKNIKKEDVRICRICGCTTQNPCPGGCQWVERDLCSRCEGRG